MCDGTLCPCNLYNETEYSWLKLKWNQLKFRYMLWRVKRKMPKIPRV